MEEVSEGATPARSPRTRVRRARSVTESLLSIVLALEAFLIFFVTLVVYALDQLDPVTTFVGGAVFIVLLALTGGVLRYQAGVWIGWVLQVAVLATGFFVPVMFVIGGVFVALWTFCFIRGRQIDRDKASFFAAQSSDSSTETPKENNA